MDFADEERCPVCKTSKRDSPAMVMMAAPCGHYMCDSCSRREFYGKNATNCRECKLLIRSTELVPKIFDNGKVHKEVLIRRRDLRDMNLTLDNFDNNLDQYNDYLEMVEECAYNLTNEIDVLQTRDRIQKFYDENRRKILENHAKESRLRQQRMQELQTESGTVQQAKRHREEESKQDAIDKRKHKEALLKQLAKTSDVEITAKARPDNPTVLTFKTSARKVHTKEEVVEDPLYVYSSQERHVDSPERPPLSDRYVEMFADKERDSMFAACGYSNSIPLQRAIHDAFCCLFV